MIILNPYISFKGRAREAIEFYKTVFGGELMMTTYKDGGMSKTPSDENNLMHAMLKTENGMTLMVSDTPDGMPFQAGTSISISLSGGPEDETMLRGYWEKLSVGATISQPLAAAPWGDVFGMLTDKVGTTWMVNIAGKKA